MCLQFLEAHEPVEPVADVLAKQGVLRSAVVDGIVDLPAQADAELAPAIARVEDAAVIEGAIPLGGAGGAGLLQRCDDGQSGHVLWELTPEGVAATEETWLAAYDRVMREVRDELASSSLT